jgi:hypothetical protein
MIAGAVTALAALATVFFLFVQFWSSGVKNAKQNGALLRSNLKRQKQTQLAPNLTNGLPNSIRTPRGFQPKLNLRALQSLALTNGQQRQTSVQQMHNWRLPN